MFHVLLRHVLNRRRRLRASGTVHHGCLEVKMRELIFLAFVDEVERHVDNFALKTRHRGHVQRCDVAHLDFQEMGCRDSLEECSYDACRSEATLVSRACDRRHDMAKSRSGCSCTRTLFR